MVRLDRHLEVPLVDLGPEGFLASIEGKPRADVDEWQTQMQLRSMRAGRIGIYAVLRS